MSYKIEYASIPELLASLGLRYASISPRTGRGKYHVQFVDKANVKRCHKRTTKFFGLIHRKFIVNGQTFIFKYCTNNVFYITPIS